jgi:hypothetical protein
VRCLVEVALEQAAFACNSLDKYGAAWHGTYPGGLIKKASEKLLEGSITMDLDASKPQYPQFHWGRRGPPRLDPDDVEAEDTEEEIEAARKEAKQLKEFCENFIDTVVPGPSPPDSEGEET